MTDYREKIGNLSVLTTLVIGVSMVCSASDGSKKGMDDVIHRFSADESAVARFYDMGWSPFCDDRHKDLYQQWLKQLEEVNFNGLDSEGRIDYLLLRNQITYDLVRIARGRKRLDEVEALIPFRAAIQDLERRRWEKAPVDSQAAAGTISTIPDVIHKLRERIERGKKKDEKKEDKSEKPADKPADKPQDEKSEPPIASTPLIAKQAASAVDEIRQTLKRWFNYHEGFIPEFSWWVKKPYDDAQKSLEEYSKFLREEIAGIKGKDDDPLLGEPIGAEALAEDLAHEMIPYSPQQLIAIGEREFAWCEARMKETAKEMGLGDDWKAALAKVKNIHEPPGKQDEYVVEQARDAISFVREHDLVSVPRFCEETWRMTMMSLDEQRSVPYAAYNGQQMLVAYANESMKHEDKLMSMRGNNKYFTRIVTAHELIPGHHLQNYFAARHHAYRDMFSTPFFVEGWAVYWETRLWDLGYARSPEDRIGMLFWRMHRCARILVTLKFHLGLMSPKEMVNFLVERVGHEKFGATSEVRRFISGGYSPLYQCGYMLGALQLRALREEAGCPAKRTEKEFNDAVLQYGPIPVELIRAGMMDIPLTRDSKSMWMFTGSPAN